MIPWLFPALFSFLLLLTDGFTVSRLFQFICFFAKQTLPDGSLDEDQDIDQPRFSLVVAISNKMNVNDSLSDVTSHLCQSVNLRQLMLCIREKKDKKRRLKYVPEAKVAEIRLTCSGVQGLLILDSDSIEPSLKRAEQRCSS